MTDADYRRALDGAVHEYETLGEQRRGIDRRLGELAQTIGTLSRLLGLAPTVPLGLTDAVRLILRSGVPMTPVDVRDRLLAIGFDVSKYANDLAAVHTVLKRLNESGEARFIPGRAGRHQYGWNTGVRTIFLPDIVNVGRDNAAERATAEARPERKGALAVRRNAARKRKTDTRSPR
ncbi:MAG: hypothetical protein ACRD1V_19935 [Vicinamibacterales bacterium]